MDARLICTLLVLSLISTGLSGPRLKPLKCYTCYSKKSWADCDRNSRVFSCPSFADTCMAVDRVSTMKDGNIVHEFARSCFTTQECTIAKCERSWGSKVARVNCGGHDGALECCSTPRCNRRNP